MNNQNKGKKQGKLGVVLMCLLLVVLLAVNIGGGIYYNVITQFFSKTNIDKDAVADTAATAEELVERMVGEGIVLLENRNNTLPLGGDEMNVNLFGWGSIDAIYTGGMGSGSGNTKNTGNYLEAMEASGFTINNELVDFYKGLGYARNIANSYGSFDVDYTKVEAPVSEYSDELLSNAKTFSDVAIVMLGRLGNEAADQPTDMSWYGGSADEHYLELSADEEDLLDMVAGTFDKVILLINSSYQMELGFLEGKDIDAVLWIGSPGQTGMNAVAKVLKGDINPSGRLVDTYAYDLTSAPSYQNFGEFFYTNASFMETDWFGGDAVESFYPYLDYAEGIYVGYRYYETRYIDNETGECDEAAYQNAVQYPFGYGGSYTTFKQEISGFTSNNKTASMTVKVTNTGNVAGKEVVQVYLTAPYTVGGIEKSHVSLIGFAKTGLLEPGASEVVEISFAIEDMASFDYKDKGCYVLDAGSYEIKLMANAHDLIDSETIEISSTIVYGDGNKRDSDVISAVTRFEDVEGGVTYLSRADWEGTWPGDVAMEREASEELIYQLGAFAISDDAIAANSGEFILADNGLELKDFVGLSYDDPKWEQLLQQMSAEEMQKLIGYGGYATQEIDSISKPYSIELDGPAGILALVNEHSYNGVLYPSAVLIASTWNTDLAQEMGEAFSAEAVAWGISGIYGPGINTHRSPFGGRNYEYYSEDGFLAGKIAAGMVKGFSVNGVYCTIKHFALYEQSLDFGTSTWSNEQAIREIYLKPFEIAVKEADANAIMSSFNRIGGTWTGGSYALQTEVLRNEWGFEGFVITDYFTGEPFMNADQAVYAGNDLLLTTTGGTLTDTSDASLLAMRKACHNILFTVANSVAMEFNDFGPTPYWLYILIAIDVLAVAGALWFFILRSKNKKTI